MGHYVYQYLHPEYGHLYCGRTGNLDKRIYEHNNSDTDNIPREYKNLLNESIIVYVELENKAQEIAVEAFCIDKFNPFLNKSLNYNNKASILEMKLPKWKLYSIKKSKKKLQLNDLEKEIKILEENINTTKNKIKLKKEDLEDEKNHLFKINYQVKACQKMIQNRNKNILFSFSEEDMKWFYKHCKNNDVKFYSEIYDKLGNFVVQGTIYCDHNKKMILQLYNDEKIPTHEIKEDSALFSIFIASLYHFYPDKDIYSQFQISLLEEMNNNTYNKFEKKEKEYCNKMLLKFTA